MARSSGIRIIVMCKAPIPGAVKTRLMCRYSAAEAASLHAAMATTVIARARRLFDDVVIAADDVNHPFFAAFGLPLIAQQDGDLGQRMHRQLELAFDGGVHAALVLGTDSPHMPDTRLLAAAAALKQVDVVVGPVDDGGYDLLGMRRMLSVFDQVVWSSGQVLDQTLHNIHGQHLSVQQLDTSFDVDFPDDIDRAKQAGWDI